MTEAEFMAALAPVHALLWHHARRLSRRRTVEAEDLYQHAAAVLWANRAKVAGHPEPSAWLAQAAKWAMLRVVETSDRHQFAAFDPDAHATAAVVLDPEPEEFGTLLALLPMDVQGLAIRRFADGLTLEQLAADAGITPASVRHRLEAAFEQVRGRLAG